MLSGRAARYGMRADRAARVNKTYVLLGLLLVLGIVLYQYQAGQYFMHDDEGGYAYAAWRVSVGEAPYRDFLSPQMPAFLYWGGLVVRLFGRSYVALRMATMTAMLLAAALLYAANYELFGLPVAVVSAALFLIEPIAFHDARFFRPEALMLLFQMAGIYAFVLGERRQRLGLVALAGTFFGLSTLSKLFGLLPLAGCFLYLLYAWRREGRSPKRTLSEGLALSAPALLVVGLAALAFTLISPYFSTAILGHHTMQGAGMPFLERAAKAAWLYIGYVTDQPVAAALAAVGTWLVLRQSKALPSLLVWLMPTALGFVVLSRELQQRHLAYLTPALVTLMAVTVVHALALLKRLPQRRLLWAAGVTLVAGLTLLAVGPWLALNGVDAILVEQDSTHLSALIQRLAPGDQVVMSDYPGLNFLTGRRSTYWAAGISGGAAQSGQIRGAMLIDEIESRNVEVVVINTWGGAHQMAGMVDYPEFLRYVRSRFSLIEQYKCSYEAKVFEVYARGAALPPDRKGSAAQTGGDGAVIELRLRMASTGAASFGHWEDLWTVVQWQDGTGAWHDVGGWQGAPKALADREADSVWAVSPTDLGKGPFRWVVLRGRGGVMLVASEPFHLPSQAGGAVRIEMTLNP